MSGDSPWAVADRLWRRILLVIGRGRVTFVNDSGVVQMMQIRLSDLELRDNTPRLSEYGFTSLPPLGSDAVVVFLGGDRSSGVVIATGNQKFRVKPLADGEVALYDDKGQSVYLSATGIRVDGGGKPILITNTPLVRLESDLHVTGDILDHCDGQEHTVADMRAIYNEHTHVDSRGGTTTAPGVPQ